MSVPEPAATPAPYALELEDLDVVYQVRGTDRQVLRGVTLNVRQGEAYGLVGESGCGKSTAALAIVNYLPRNGRVRSGGLRIDGRDALRLSGAELRRLRSESVSMVYQNPGAALNPSIRVGKQVAEVFRIRGEKSGEATDLARYALERVQIADPGSVMGRYPHQLSGGMQQRVVIAMALATEPALLILDEPTTGLDATVEAEVLDLVAGLQAELRTSVLFISHNLGIIRKMCDRVGVLYAGRLVEEGDTETVLRDPRHPYTVGLLRCVPRGGVRKDHGRLDTIPGFMPNVGEELPGCVFAGRCLLAEEICHTEEPPAHPIAGTHTSRCHFHERAQSLPREEAAELELPAIDRDAAPLLRFDGLGKVFKQQGHDVHALVDVSAAIWPGETLGLVGESGSGKTTLARSLLGLVQPTTGAVVLDGRELGGTLAQRTSDDLRSLQIVFQNPDSALNRRHQVRRILRRSLKKLAGMNGAEAEQRMHSLMSSVRLSERYVSARPSQLSGGLKQRLAIARAFAGDPQLVVCDEPTSALDVSVQAAILNLLVELQARERVSYLFISHDLGVVRYVSDRIAVLYLGRLMELGTSETVFAGPHHPYTEALLSAVPTIDGSERPRIKLEGDIPSAADPPTGCVFHTRCPRRVGPVCDETEPPLIEIEPDHLMRCHLTLDELRAAQAEDPGGGGARVVKIRAAVLEATGGPHRVQELELDAPHAGEVLVRLGASGVCHSDYNAIDGTAETRCPAVLGHEGAGVVEAIGAGVSRVVVGDRVALSWAPSCGTCGECLRDLPQLCSTAWPAMGTGGLMDGTTRLSRDGEPVYHYSFLSTFADACVVPEKSCVPIPKDVPFDVAGLVGCAVTTGVGAVWRTAGARPGDRVAVVGCGGVGLSALMAAVAVGAEPVVAVDAAPGKLETARSFGASAGVLWQGSAEATAEAIREASGGGVDYAIEATGRPEAMTAAFLATRARGAAVLIGIPRADATVTLPALSIPRMERRVLGSIYGSSRPERDFGTTLALYRSGRLPLDRLVSHRLPLDEVERGFELMHSGEALRVVLDLNT